MSQEAAAFIFRAHNEAAECNYLIPSPECLNNPRPKKSKEVHEI
jgi:hypothetical protein